MRRNARAKTFRVRLNVAEIRMLRKVSSAVALTPSEWVRAQIRAAHVLLGTAAATEVTPPKSADKTKCGQDDCG